MKVLALLLPLICLSPRIARAADQWNRFVPAVVPSQTAFPNPSYAHTAVWTGSEMIVWGGLNDHQPLNTGGRLAAATHTWTALPTTGAPTARSGHTAVWTGTEMIIWGGKGLDGSPLNDGARYSLATHSWKPLPAAGAPASRWGHTAVWTGTEMIIWGGAGEGELAFGSGTRYDPVSDSWVPMAAEEAPGARFGHTAIWTGDEMVIWGGRRRADENCGSGGLYCPMSDGAHYSPAFDTWLPTPSSGAPAARFEHTTVWTGTEMIVWGGRTDVTWVTNTGARYNPVTRAWTETILDGAPSARVEHTAVWTGADMIVWGGGDGVISSTAPVSQGRDTGARYSPTTNTWSPVAMVNAARPRRAHSAVWTGQSMIVCGGWDIWRFSLPALNDCRGYIAGNNTWSGAPTMPDDLYGNTAVWTGGEIFVQGEGVDWKIAKNAAWRYLPELRTWAGVPSSGAPAGRKLASSVWTGSEIIVWGGVTFVEHPRQPHWSDFNDGGRFSPSSHTWNLIPATELLAPRIRHSAVWTGTEMIVWGGGRLPAIGGPPYNDGARYAPASNSWQPLPAAGAPGHRQGHLAVWTGTEMIIWGGWGAMELQGARYRPATNTWVSMEPMDLPSNISGYRGVWTGSEFIALAFGNEPPTTTLVVAGGRYSPASDTWAPMNLMGAPIHQSGGFAVWTGSEMIVWGWTTQENTTIPSGARYNPVTDSWTPMTNIDSPSSGSSAVWDGSRMIVFGDTGAVGAAYYTPDFDATLEVVRTVNENGTLSLTFSSTLGRSYTLWQTDSLLSGNWSETGLPPLAGTGTPLTFTVPAPPTPGRFFRVQAGP